MERKPASHIVSIRPVVTGPTTDHTPPTGGGSTHALPPQQRGSARERRSNRMLAVSTDRNRTAAELDDSVALNDGVPFLAQTHDEIVYRFLRGVEERRIAEALSGRHYTVARVDIERVIRSAFVAERAQRVGLERLARGVAA